MQVFFKQRMVFLAVPKTGSTAFETAMRPLASMDVRRPPGTRHTSARRWHRTWGPFLDQSMDFRPELVAVLRDPLTRLESWYRYRLTRDSPKQVSHLSFDSFVQQVLSDDPPPEARIGSQAVFVSDRNGRILVDHLFAVEKPRPLLRFLRQRLEKRLKVKKLNVSHPAPITLQPETEAAFRKSRAAEFALHSRVLAAGQLRTPQGAEEEPTAP